jgi:hypothetical protein
MMPITPFYNQDPNALQFGQSGPLTFNGQPYLPRPSPEQLRGGDLGGGSTTYGPKGTTTATTGMGFPVNDYASFYRALAQRQLAAQQQQQPQAQSSGPGGASSHAVQGPKQPPSDPLYALKLHDAAVQLMAKDGPAPVKYVTIAGQTFPVQDQLAMNGYQRQAFGGNQALQGASPYSGGGGPAIERAPDPSVTASPQPAPDANWRQQSMLANAPQASGLFDQFKILDPDEEEKQRQQQGR